MDWSSIIQQLLSAAVTIALAVVVPFLIQWLTKKAALAQDAMGERWADAMREAVDIAVGAVEQMTLAKMITDESRIKKQAAIEIAEGWLLARGVKVDLGVLSNQIENAVRDINWRKILESD